MALQDLTMMLSFHFGLPSEPEDSQYGKSWLERGSVDVLVHVDQRLSLLQVPGDDRIPGSNDVRSNVCPGGGVNDNGFTNYALMVHEAGHALGLSDYIEREFWSNEVAHPSVPDAVMNYDEIGDEPDCSPHPFDIMAIEALYQSVERP